MPRSLWNLHQQPAIFLFNLLPELYMAEFHNVRGLMRQWNVPIKWALCCMPEWLYELFGGWSLRSVP